VHTRDDDSPRNVVLWRPFDFLIFLTRLTNPFIGVQLTQVKLTMVNQERDPKHLTKATGDILRAIHLLLIGAEPSAVALPSDIATRTGTSRAFVTKMLKHLKEQDLVEYAPYQGVRLSPTGARAAIELSRHHRLLEYFLANTLGFSLEKAHAEAERLEHVISEEFEERLAAFLGNPVACPHGTPIPNPDGSYPDLSQRAAAPLEPGVSR